ncbi:MAG TPA: hypothetical protein VJ909_01080 [Prolixibacteraceae bacterium]|nr:hypothetical protein [Prolixibacteraceae bacterium]
MKEKIKDLFSEGDGYLKDAKTLFFANEDRQNIGSCNCCEAVKRYIDAYEKYLFEKISPSKNYHVVMHTIEQKDPNFKKFNDVIYEIKCFADEARKEPESFFLYDDEIDDVLKNVLKIRNYIASKVHINEEFMHEFSNNDIMAI